jgi:hypothetical protein
MPARQGINMESIGGEYQRVKYRNVHVGAQRRLDPETAADTRMRRKFTAGWRLGHKCARYL